MSTTNPLQPTGPASTRQPPSTPAAGNQPSPARSSRTGARQRLAALCEAALTWGGMVLTWFLMVNTYTGQRLENIALRGSSIGAQRVSDHARTLLSVISMPAAVVLVLLILGVALWRGARRRSIYAAVVVVATNLSAQALKYWVFTRPDFGFSVRWDGGNTLPSGHTAMAASAAVALVLVVGASWRGAAAWVGALVAAAMGYSTLVCQWHRPADVIAAILLAAGWAFLAVALGAWHEESDRPRPPRGRAHGIALRLLAWAGLASALVATIGEVIAWIWINDGDTRLIRFIAYAAGSAGTVAAACLTMAGLAALGTVATRASRPTAADSPAQR